MQFEYLKSRGEGGRRDCDPSVVVYLDRGKNEWNKIAVNTAGRLKAIQGVIIIITN